MNCYVVKTVVKRPAARGFFVLFYDWSVRSRSARSFHVTSQLCRASSQKHTQYHYSSASSWPKPNSRPLTEPPLSSHLRRLMRQMPHSVVVATATATATASPALYSPSNPNLQSDPPSNPSIEYNPPNYKGMTISSFTTLTLTPQPIITFNIRRPSQTLTAIASSRRFNIHILSATESGVAVADAFTRGNTADDVFESDAFVFLNRDTRAGKGGELGGEPPLLNAEGIKKVLACVLLDEGGNGLVEVGDHMLVLGRVVNILEAPKLDGEDGEGTGLGYLDGRYRRVGDVIDVPRKVKSGNGNSRLSVATSFRTM